MAKTNKPLSIEQENEKLREVLRFVYQKQKSLASENTHLLQENQKIIQALRNQTTIIPELQIQNRVLHQQNKSLALENQQQEKITEDFISKFNLLKKKRQVLQRKLWLLRVIALFLFSVATTFIYFTYREASSYANIKKELSKTQDEKETLTQQNINYFNERNSFQKTIEEKYKTQIDALNQKLAIAQKESFDFYQKLTQVIENFKSQKTDLENEFFVKLNLMKNEYENKLKNLTFERDALKEQLAENQIKNREFSVKDFNLTSIENNKKYQQFMNKLNRTEEPKKTTFSNDESYPNADSDATPTFESSIKLEPIEFDSKSKNFRF